MVKLLSVNNLCAGYNGDFILKNLGIEVSEGEFVTVLGLNGSGKSTLLRTIIGILKAKSGSILFNNIDLMKLDSTSIVKLGIGMAMQVNKLFSNLKVSEHYLLVKDIYKIPNSEFEKQLRNVLKYFPSLRHLMNRSAGLLSMGERQLVGLSILLLQKSSLWLLDEPSSGLDLHVADSLFQLMKKIKHEFGITILMVEQNLAKALEISDRILFLKEGSLSKFDLNNN